MPSCYYQKKSGTSGDLLNVKEGRREAAQMWTFSNSNLSLKKKKLNEWTWTEL
jgi:hypothetical protein